MHGEKDVIIDLKLNDNLIPQGHFMRYQLPNGTDVVQHFTKTDIDLCHYKVSVVMVSALIIVTSHRFLCKLIFFFSFLIGDNYRQCEIARGAIHI